MDMIQFIKMLMTGRIIMSECVTGEIREDVETKISQARDCHARGRAI
jgi:hypothetical protein